MAKEESFTLLSLGLSIIALRTWWRWSNVGFKAFDWDDYLMPVSGILFTIVTSLAYLVGAKYHGLTNSYMTEEQRAALDLDSVEAYNRVSGSKLQIIGWELYAMDLWVLKLCLTVFYSRLTLRLNDLKLRLRIGYVIIGVSWTTATLCLIAGCHPTSHYWQIYPNPGALCQPTNSPLNVWAVLIPNIITDLYLLSIPLPVRCSNCPPSRNSEANEIALQLLWKVNIGLRTKASLMLLFSGAVFIIAAGTVRAIVILSAGPNGAVMGSEWACREIFVAIVVTNLPIIQPLMRKVAGKMGLSGIFSRSSPTRSYQIGSGNGPTGYKLGSRPNNSKATKSNNMNTTHATAWGSDEHILYDERHQPGSKDIKVAKEITVVVDDAASTSKAPSSTGETKSDWGYEA
ncbi:Uu.00g031780.m01.CDS01 [Anthostomella pinea]|uniref:Uu.00g031780.m01.CDS01 n=1 Tax=Anthostomella pinea TaxID=933095 RepID=A0AAI8YD30_9PEZI|nr:Uu.00g031780.m01.CDS01 [Anthostomella pinea]